MMPAPQAIREAGAMPYAGVAPERRSTVVRVLYATNRAPRQPRAGRARYGSARDAELRVGTASVRLGPESWGWEDLVSSTLAGQRPPIHVTDVREIGTMERGSDSASEGAALLASMSADGVPMATEEVFAATVNAQLAGSGRHDVVVYVPGFNLTFELGVRRVAEFSHYLGHDGVFITYAWPAHSHPFAYSTDRQNARRSVEDFLAFLGFLAERTDVDRIHLLTSSAGAPVVSDALIAIHARHPGETAARVREQTRIGEVIYAASDQSVEEFCEMLRSGAAEMAEHITVYSSSVDMGLLLTRAFGSGDSTIGRLPAHMREADAALLRERADLVTVVDVTNAMAPAGRGDFWAHRYWYLNPWVSSDLLGVLRHRLDPSQRALVAEGAVWAFPDDYEERLREQLGLCGLVAGSVAAE